jgi:ABC-2 type transport system permease protein
MTAQRIGNVVRKEWENTFRSLNSTLLVTLLPLAIIAQLLAVIYLVGRFVSPSAEALSALNAALAKLEAWLPAMAQLEARDRLILLLLSQSPVYLLLIPVMIANTLATFSIVEEKLSGSLEALLATPVRTWELLLGKTLAGALPAVAMAWISGAVFLFGTWLIGAGHLLALVLTPVWFISLGLLVPLITLFAYLLGIIGSARAADARSAQTTALVAVLPVLALVAVQVGGLVLLTPLRTLLLAAILALLDLAVLRLATLLFQRESIIVRWK